MEPANVSNNIIWVRDSRGHIVIDKTSKKEFVRVMVGRVDPTSPLAKAKFQFQLCQPFESPFAQDFDTIIQVLEGIQGKIAQTGDRWNMIMSDMNYNSKLIRFMCNVFEQHVHMCMSCKTSCQYCHTETAHSEACSLSG